MGMLALPIIYELDARSDVTAYHTGHVSALYVTGSKSKHKRSNAHDVALLLLLSKSMSVLFLAYEHSGCHLVSISLVSDGSEHRETEGDCR